MSCQDSELSREEIKKKVGGRFRTVKRNGCQEQEMSSGSRGRRRCQDKEMSIRKRRPVKEVAPERLQHVATRKGCREKKVSKRKRCQRTKDINKAETDNGFGNQVVVLPSSRLSLFLAKLPPPGLPALYFDFVYGLLMFLPMFDERLTYDPFMKAFMLVLPCLQRLRFMYIGSYPSDLVAGAGARYNKDILYYLSLNHPKGKLPPKHVSEPS